LNGPGAEGHLRQQGAVDTGVRQLICAAKHMGELVVQTHCGAAESPTGEPGASQRLSPSLQVVRLTDRTRQPVRQRVDGFLGDL
jgi:hypothetical protein